VSLDGIPNDLIVVGKVLGSYGLKGWIKVQPFESASQTNLLKTNNWWLIAADSPASSYRPRALVVVSPKTHNSVVVAGCPSLDQPEQAQALRGQLVAIARSEFSPIKAAEFYWVDLIGCNVRNREGIELGKISSVDDHGAHAILQVLANEPVATPRGWLIPFVSQYIDSVQLSERLVLVDWQSDWATE
jgi:16S rRNA processing protein RimM